MPNPQYDPTLAQFAADTASNIVSKKYNIPIQEIKSPTRKCAYVARARQTAMYLTNVVLGVPFNILGPTFGRDRTTASYAARIIEDNRDNPEFDKFIAELEMAVAHRFMSYINPKLLETYPLLNSALKGLH